MIRVWAGIMEALPTARLLLKNKPFACESARAHTLGLLASEVTPTSVAPVAQICGIGTPACVVCAAKRGGG